MSSNFDQIGLPTTELAALGRLKIPHRLLMGKSVSPLFLGHFYVPQTEGGGGTLFLVRIPSASASASALLRFRALSFEPIDGF